MLNMFNKFMKLMVVGVGGFLLTSCLSTPPPPIVVTPQPTTTPSTTLPTYTFGVVACGVDVPITSTCPTPLEGATIKVDTLEGYESKLSNKDGYALFTSTIPYSDVWIHLEGREDARANIQPPAINTQNITLYLPSILPPLPSRDEMVNVHITFQGLMVNCPPFGNIPLFEAGLAWMGQDCRNNVYVAKHQSQAWGNGDTHAIIMVPSGPPLYDEPNQPYNSTNFPSLDWTNGGSKIDSRLADLVHEVIVNGFTKILLFEGGDGVDGYPIAMNQLDLIHDALLNSKYGDLRGYVVPLPGWDGVFYGWEPSHTLIPNWVNKCRSLFIYCGFEHSTGHIPLGEGDQDWTGQGAMRGIDLLLEEFNDDTYDDSIWQIAARVLGPAYVRPSNQPPNDDPGSPFAPNAGQFILRQPTERGFIKPCAFEFHEYTDVHSNGGVDELSHTIQQREYLKRVGYTCGG